MDDQKKQAQPRRPKTGLKADWKEEVERTHKSAPKTRAIYFRGDRKTEDEAGIDDVQEFVDQGSENPMPDGTDG